MKIAFEHLGLLCLNVEATAKILKSSGYQQNETEIFLQEGTKEIYIGASNCTGRLLLLEAVSVGPYKLALEKRGPGLHHIAIGVENLQKFIKKISHSGWFLHPASFQSIYEKSIAWLVRPNLPLIEVFEKQKNSSEETSFINEIFLPETQFNDKLFSEIELHLIKKSKEKHSFITIANKKFDLNELARTL